MYITNQEKEVTYQSRETVLYRIPKQREDSEKDNAEQAFLTSFELLGRYMLNTPRYLIYVLSWGRFGAVTRALSRFWPGVIYGLIS